MDIETIRTQVLASRAKVESAPINELEIGLRELNIFEVMGHVLRAINTLHGARQVDPMDVLGSTAIVIQQNVQEGEQILTDTTIGTNNPNALEAKQHIRALSALVAKQLGCTAAIRSAIADLSNILDAAHEKITEIASLQMDGLGTGREMETTQKAFDTYANHFLQDLNSGNGV